MQMPMSHPFLIPSKQQEKKDARRLPKQQLPSTPISTHKPEKVPAPIHQIVPPSTTLLPTNSNSPLSAVLLRSKTHRSLPHPSSSLTYATLSAALPLRLCPAFHPPPPGVTGLVVEIGEMRDWRRGALLFTGAVAEYIGGEDKEGDAVVGACEWA